MVQVSAEALNTHQHDRLCGEMNDYSMTVRPDRADILLAQAQAQPQAWVTLRVLNPLLGGLKA